ncbi:hypothetical protein EDB85DRAFT_2148580 [Lactarius pseudohatsudake]|nr:hypothetical protein EDB85DRAFT_2148580 [Lactarius pseudohatsudake]
MLRAERENNVLLESRCTTPGGVNKWPSSLSSFYFIRIYPYFTFSIRGTDWFSSDPPVEIFVLPPSENGQLWEISDESRGGIPYNHHTKSGETVWEKPDGFVIPLTVLQNTALGRRLSKSFSSTPDQSPPPHAAGQQPRPVVPHARSYKKEPERSAYASQPNNRSPFFNTIATGACAATYSWLGSEHSADPHTLAPLFHPPRSPPQSPGVAVERLTRTPPQSPDTPSSVSAVSSESGYVSASESTRVKPKLKIEAPAKNGPPTAPVRPVPPTQTKGPTVAGKEIGRPVLSMTSSGLVPREHQFSSTHHPYLRLLVSSKRSVPGPGSAHPILWYFAAHRTGFIFRRKVPVGQMMVWQRSALPTPLLNLSRPLHMDAVRVFRDVQRLMGDSEKGATAGSNTPRLEEARRLLGEGLANGELRDEVYCQVMKQLTNNPNADEHVGTAHSVGDSYYVCYWSPSRHPRILSRTFTRFSRNTRERPGRVDVLAKHCLKRLAAISKKGPRGKPPSLAEIETASDAAFNPSTFGEPLDAVFRLQERTYPTQRVPIGLPFLAYGMRLDRGSYTLEGVDDPHVPASLFKLRLRELVDPLVPSEMYNDCIAFAGDAEACCAAVERLPTVNRRVVLFVIGFLRLFLDECVLAATKMTSANLALVMAPNLLRCGSDSMTIVFNDAQYEQAFVHNLLLHLNCGEIDAQDVPQHGLGAVPSAALRASKSRNRRAHS